MKYRFYINQEDSHRGEFNYVVTPEGKKIEYSYMCSQPEHNPPKDRGYKLAYQTDGDYNIIIDPYGMRGIFDYI